MNNDQIEGKTKQAEGKGQEAWGDAKEKADETWDEAKDKLDDLGDKIGETKDKLAKDKGGHDADDDEVLEDAARQGEPRVGPPVHAISIGSKGSSNGAVRAPRCSLVCGACRRRSSRDASTWPMPGRMSTPCCFQASSWALFPGVFLGPRMVFFLPGVDAGPAHGGDGRRSAGAKGCSPPPDSSRLTQTAVQPNLQAAAVADSSPARPPPKALRSGSRRLERGRA